MLLTLEKFITELEVNPITQNSITCQQRIEKPTPPL